MVQIAADTLGVKPPRLEVTVAAAQGVLIRDWRAKALFGAAKAVISARRIADAVHAKAAILAEARLFALVFEKPAIIFAGGLELA